MNNDVFQGIVDIGVTHAERLQWAMNKLSAMQPFTADKLQHLSAMDMAVLDQFIVRFSKLQDVMGAKLLPAVLELTHEEGDLSTFIDKLHRLEKIGAIPSADQWLKLREMRNQFAHDYPEDPFIQASLLNKSFSMAVELLHILEVVTTFARKYQTN